eukprot:5903447-Alexandrium_andersonii.AAC.1
MIPSTFHLRGTPQDATWRNTQGSWRRNDYVAVSCSLAPSVVRTFVDHTMESVGASCDHRPA